MRDQRITRTGTAAAAACLAVAALPGPPAAAARTPPPRPPSHRPTPAMPDLAEGQLGLAMRSTGAVTARIARAAKADAAHRCVIPDGPASAYLLSFGAAPGVALLHLTHPGLVITLPPRPAATAPEDGGAPTGTADAAAGQATPGGATRGGDAAPQASPARDGTIQASIGGRRFVGIGGMDPEYRLVVTLSADGQRGSFAARHLVDASGGGAVDVDGAWRCPAPVASPVPSRVSVASPAARPASALAADPALHAPDTRIPPRSEAARPEASPADTTTEAATLGAAPAFAPPTPRDPVPVDSATPDPTGNAEHAASPGAAVAASPAPAPASGSRLAASPLGRATATLAASPPNRGRPRHDRAPVPGCTSTATLDGVSAALQAGRFGRRQGLAIMQFRNVVTDNAARGRVDCHADVLLSDASLHRAEYGLRSAGRRTRLHIQVARDRQGAPAPDRTPLPPPSPAGPVPEPAAPASQAPAT